MINISEKAAELMTYSFAIGSSNIKSIEMSYRDDSIYMTVDRHLVGIVEYKVTNDTRKCEHGMMAHECSYCDETKKDHEIAIHVNNLRDIVVKYADSQQLREHLRQEVLKFMGR